MGQGIISDALVIGHASNGYHLLGSADAADGEVAISRNADQVGHGKRPVVSWFWDSNGT
jgi:hypothetical protein